MHELWYKVTTAATVNMIRDYATAKNLEKNGAEIEVVYKYSDLDRKSNRPGHYVGKIKTR